jgi:hypothetical protein
MLIVQSASLDSIKMQPHLHAKHALQIAQNVQMLLALLAQNAILVSIKVPLDA